MLFTQLSDYRKEQQSNVFVLGICISRICSESEYPKLVRHFPNASSGGGRCGQFPTLWINMPATNNDC
jgi:hypothetical protein